VGVSEVSRDHRSNALNAAPLTISQGNRLFESDDDLNGVMRVQVHCIHAPDVGEHLVRQERCPSPAAEHERVRRRSMMIPDVDVTWTMTS
jgi:hypothetical protein